MEEEKIITEQTDEIVENVENVEVEEGLEEKKVEKNEDTQPKEEQTKEERAKYAGLRRDKEQREQAQKAAQMKELEQRLKGVAKLYGYKSNNTDDILDLLEADQKGVTVEELKTAKAKEKSNVIESPEYKELLAKVQEAETERNEMLKNRDLDIIKKHYPDIDAKQIDELGDTFIGILAMKQQAGEPIDEKALLFAYEATNLEKELTKTSKPKSFGKVGGKAEIEKEFYTSEEIDNLTPKQLDDPKIFERVITSLQKIKT